MPPKKKITKEALLSAALTLVREKGKDALNARELAKAAGTSTQPIFSHYATMQALKADVIAAAHQCYLAYQQKETAEERYPAYKASGMAYIRFAKEESELFKLLFMRDRREEEIPATFSDGSVELLSHQYQLPKKAAERFHLAMWIYVHGIATMCATSYLAFDEDEVSSLITEAFQGLKNNYYGDSNDERNY